jgi:hypothetical protein
MQMDDGDDGATFMKYGRMSDVDDGDNGTTIYEV